MEQFYNDKISKVIDTWINEEFKMGHCIYRYFQKFNTKSNYL